MPLTYVRDGYLISRREDGRTGRRKIRETKRPTVHAVGPSSSTHGKPGLWFSKRFRKAHPSGEWVVLLNPRRKKLRNPFGSTMIAYKGFAKQAAALLVGGALVDFATTSLVPAKYLDGWKRSAVQASVGAVAYLAVNKVAPKYASAVAVGSLIFIGARLLFESTTFTQGLSSSMSGLIPEREGVAGLVSEDETVGIGRMRGHLGQSHLGQSHLAPARR